jgi:hypothetical protein
VSVWLILTWRYWWIPGAVFWKSGWTTRAEAAAGGLQAALVGDDMAGGLQVLWSSASGLWLGLARSNFLANALGSERGYLLGVVPRSVWSYDPSHTWHEFAILEYSSLLDSAVDSALPILGLAHTRLAVAA